MGYSVDLRERVVKFVKTGGSRAQAARRFEVGEATVYRWLGRGEKLAASKTGPKGCHTLDWEGLRRTMKKRPDAILRELAKEFGAGTTSIWYALEKMKLSRKKNVDVQRSG
jgi:transposase